MYLARMLGASLYGVIGFATAVTLYFNRIADGGIELGLGVREIAAAPNRIRAVAPSVLVARFGVAAALAFLIALAGVLVMPQPDGSVLAVYGLTLLMVGLSTRWIHLGLERSRLVAAVRTGGEVVMVLVVVLLVRSPEDVARVPLAQFVGDALAAWILLRWLRRDGFTFAVQVDWKVIRPLYRRARPLVWSALLGLMVYNSDLIFLRVFSGPAAVGYYAAAYALISFLINLGTTYCLSLLPTITRLAPTRDQQHGLYHTAMAHVFAIGLPAAVGGSILAPLIIQFVFGTTYGASGDVLRLLAWSVPLSLLRGVSVVSLMASAREDQLFRGTAWGTGANVVLNLALIPPFGMLGAAAATLVTEAIRLVLSLYYGAHEGFHLTGFARFWRSIAATGAMAATLFVADPSALWLALGVGVFSYGAALIVLGGIRVTGGVPRLSV